MSFCSSFFSLCLSAESLQAKIYYLSLSKSALCYSISWLSIYGIWIWILTLSRRYFVWRACLSFSISSSFISLILSMLSSFSSHNLASYSHIFLLTHSSSNKAFGASNASLSSILILWLIFRFRLTNWPPESCSS